MTVILLFSLPPSLRHRVHTTNPDLGKRAQKVDLPFIACDVCTLVMTEVGEKEEKGRGGEWVHLKSSRGGSYDTGAFNLLTLLTLPPSLPPSFCLQLHNQTAVLATKAENLVNGKPKKSVMLKLTKRVCDHATFEGRWISYYDIQVGRGGGTEGRKETGKGGRGG